ncbi:uncharacterized protein AMSG_00695 [Thecamonas trahens ATCC 50062]|uniref:Uncharacterized protein n=1 Tax=Thecamonas trahens ATCC 50062 TaxID=461836 RepID=A0A0L0DGS6_THETB|nr:hypothetical protein AMSG_00695 [Thecamonas trahens ATCC 50062]KNC50533.1 hypothetical protein AMSG_00695 [Thecamonas trahens ATCC 50062]|eukprot:XP_013762425.1 hypothetical protein AMSG_00695 [Thecamonas trahens ATCC 50062]
MTTRAFPLVLDLGERSGTRRTADLEEETWEALTALRTTGVRRKPVALSVVPSPPKRTRKMSARDRSVSYGAHVDAVRRRRRRSLVAAERVLVVAGEDGGDAAEQTQQNSGRRKPVPPMLGKGADGPGWLGTSFAAFDSSTFRTWQGSRQKRRKSQLSSEGRRKVADAVEARDRGLAALKKLREEVEERQALQEATVRGTETLVYSLRSSVKPDFPPHVLERVDRGQQHVLYFDPAHDGPWYGQRCKDVAREVANKHRQTRSARHAQRRLREAMRKASEERRSAYEREVEHRVAMRSASRRALHPLGNADDDVKEQSFGGKHLYVAMPPDKALGSAKSSLRLRRERVMRSEYSGHVALVELPLETRLGSGSQVTDVPPTPALDKLESSVVEEMAHLTSELVLTNEGSGLVRITKLGRQAHRRAAREIEEAKQRRRELDALVPESSVLPANFKATYGMQSYSYGDIGMEANADGVFSVVAYRKSDLPYGMPLPTGYRDRLRQYASHAADIEVRNLDDEYAASALAAARQLTAKPEPSLVE